jgi:hypothetical protein
MAVGVMAVVREDVIHTLYIFTQAANPSLPEEEFWPMPGLGA